MQSDVVSVNDYDYCEFKALEILKVKGRHKRKYYNCVCAFDIETTLLDDIKQSIMYVWQFQINERTIIGRTWDEFRTFINRINAICTDGYLMTFIHNLSFEWQFLKSIIPVDDVFAMDLRKVLYFFSGQFEFRCSYLLSNMSLDKFLKHVGVGEEFEKVKGFDYSKKRYPNTKLTHDEMLYIINDVRGLVKAIQLKLEKDGDTLYSLPRTSTGYVRRIFRKAIGGYIKWFKQWLPDEDVLIMLQKAYRGGNCHANRFYTGSIVKDVKFKDISSSYPFQLLRWKYPKKFTKGNIRDFKYYIKYGKACLFDIEITDLKLKDALYGCPYLAKAKMDVVHGGVFDNGRILEMDYGKCTMTEIDFIIMSKQYDFKYEISNLYIANKGYLPKTFRKTLLDMYATKTALKGGDKYEYNKFKNMINAVYGMTVQNPLKPKYKLNGIEINVDGDIGLDALVQEYHEHGWLPYQVGVYVSAYARAQLYSAIDALPAEHFLYCDTDSVAYVGDHDDIFDALNDKYIDDELSALDKNGVRHYAGAFEDDKVIDRFITLGAKKYAYEDKDGLHITCSGVNKKDGAIELGKLENFKEGFIFKQAGGTESRFNDYPEMKSIHINGIDIEVVSNVAIIDSTYTLGIAGDYRRLLNGLNDAHIRDSLHVN